MEKAEVYITPCKHLKFHVPEKERGRYSAYLWEIRNEDGENTPKEIEERKKELLRFDADAFDQEFYRAFCSRLNRICLPVSSTLFVLDGGFVPVATILGNSGSIIGCRYKELSEPETAEDFIINRLDTEYL